MKYSRHKRNKSSLLVFRRYIVKPTLLWMSTCPGASLPLWTLTMVRCSLARLITMSWRICSNTFKIKERIVILRLISCPKCQILNSIFLSKGMNQFWSPVILIMNKNIFKVVPSNKNILNCYMFTIWK